MAPTNDHIDGRIHIATVIVLVVQTLMSAIFLPMTWQTLAYRG